MRGFAVQIQRKLPAVLAVLAGLQVSALMQPAAAQTYPERPVRIVSVTSAGTGLDDYTRLLARYFGQKLGQSFVVENKPGANMILASDYVAKAAPDGYTLLLSGSGAMAANPFLYKRLPYDPLKDFVPVARLSALPVAVVVPGSSPYRTVADLVAAARAKPGKLNYGTSSTGYRTILAAFNDVARIQAVSVPYKAASTLLPDVMTGVVDYAAIEVSAVVPHVQSGKLRALAVASPARVAQLKDVPTVAEAACRTPRSTAGPACSRPRERPLRWWKSWRASRWSSSTRRKPRRTTPPAAAWLSRQWRRTAQDHRRRPAELEADDRAGRHRAGVNAGRCLLYRDAGHPTNLL